MKYKKLKLNEIIDIDKSEYNLWTICLNNANQEGIYSFSGDKKSVARLMQHISWKKRKGKKQSFRVIDTPLCLQFQRLDREKKWDKWLFLGAYKVNGDSIDKDGNATYNLELLDKYSSLVERLVVEYKKHQGDKQAKIPTRLIEEIDVVEILEKRYVESDIDFPGYDKVKLSFRELSDIINNNVRNWKNYLSAAQCIYVVTDTSNEKLYVGSTYGSEGIWQRWSAYVKTKGTGGNKELDKLIRENPDYAFDNFQFSILESFINTDGNEQLILDRETYWKEVLKSKEFGYNRN